MALTFHFKCTLKCRLQFLSIWTTLNFCPLVMGQVIASNTVPCSAECPPVNHKKYGLEESECKLNRCILINCPITSLVPD